MPLAIRPIRPQDAPLLVEGLAALSDASVHARFLTTRRHFTSAELRYLTDVDFVDHVALVAFFDGRFVGVGRWIRDRRRPAFAEIAITIGDEWQGMGFGTELGFALADEARRRGVEHFTATMLPSNRAALALLRTISLYLSDDHYEGGLREVVAELPAPLRVAAPPVLLRPDLAEDAVAA